MVVDALAELGERQPACLQMLVAQHDVAGTDQVADERDDSDEASRQDFEQIFTERRANLDGEARLLLHLTLQRGTMVLAGIGPATGQVPFIALVQEKEHAILVDQDAFDGDGRDGHFSKTIIAGRAPLQWRVMVFRTAGFQPAS